MGRIRRTIIMGNPRGFVLKKFVLSQVLPEGRRGHGPPSCPRRRHGLQPFP